MNEKHLCGLLRKQSQMILFLNVSIYVLVFVFVRILNAKVCECREFTMNEKHLCGLLRKQSQMSPLSEHVYICINICIFVCIRVVVEYQ